MNEHGNIARACNCMVWLLFSSVVIQGCLAGTVIIQTAQYGQNASSPQAECPSPRALITFTKIDGNEVSIDPTGVTSVQAFNDGDRVIFVVHGLHVSVLGTHCEVMTALGRPCMIGVTE